MAEGRDKVAFTKKDAQRIAAAVRKVEGGDKKGKGLVFGFRGVGEDDPGATIYLGKTTSEWAIDTESSIEIYKFGKFPNESKDDPAGQEPVKTITAVNRTKNKVKADKWVLIGKAEIISDSEGDGNTDPGWYLIEERAVGCESPPSMNGDTITEDGWTQSGSTSPINVAAGSGPVYSLFLEGECLKWVAAQEICVVTSVSLGGNGLYFERQKIWAFISTSTCEPITIPTVTCDEGSSGGSGGGSGGSSY